MGLARPGNLYFLFYQIILSGSRPPGEGGSVCVIISYLEKRLQAG